VLSSPLSRRRSFHFVLFTSSFSLRPFYPLFALFVPVFVLFPSRPLLRPFVLVNAHVHFKIWRQLPLEFSPKPPLPPPQTDSISNVAYADAVGGSGAKKMRHGIAHRLLGRDSAHRWALLRNLVTELVKHDRIQTTVPKAKELRRIADKVSSLAPT